MSIEQQPDSLSADDLALITARCEALENKFAEGAPLEFAPLLEGIEERLRAPLLRELVEVAFELSLREVNDALWPEIEGLRATIPAASEEPVGASSTAMGHRLYRTDGGSSFTTLRRLAAQDGPERLGEAGQAKAVKLLTKALRRIRVTNARKHQAHRLSGSHVAWDARQVSDAKEKTKDSDWAEDELALHYALNRLARKQELQADIVELRHYGGLSLETTADVLQVELSQVDSSFRAAKAWLYRDLRNQS